MPVNRTIVSFMLAGLMLSSACTDPEMAQRIKDLETKVAELETKAVAAPGVRTAGPPGAPGAPAADDAAEQAWAEGHSARWRR